MHFWSTATPLLYLGCKENALVCALAHGLLTRAQALAGRDRVGVGATPGAVGLGDARVATQREGAGVAYAATRTAIAGAAHLAALRGFCADVLGAAVWFAALAGRLERADIAAGGEAAALANDALATAVACGACYGPSKCMEQGG